VPNFLTNSGINFSTMNLNESRNCFSCFALSGSCSSSLENESILERIIAMFGNIK